ncbi:MAG: RIP metalloprotease RseP, partial [Marinicella sp.]
MTEVLGSIFWLIVTLGVLVTFHELGHFWMARLFKVKVLRFCVGFGKPIWSRIDKHGSEIAVAPIPLGGYVKLLDIRDCEVTEEDREVVYNYKPFWQKFLIMFAGPAFNFILALFLYWLMFVVGKNEIQPTLGEPTQLMQQAGFQNKDQLKRIDGQEIKTWTDVSLSLITAGIDRRDIEVEVLTDSGTHLNRNIPFSQVPTDVSEENLINYIGLEAYRVPVAARMGKLDENLPAALAGLQEGDLLLKVNGQDISDWYAVVEIISAIESGPIEVDYMRNQVLHSVSIPALMADPDDSSRRVLGIRPMAPTEEERAYYNSLFFTLSYGPIESIPQAFKQVVKITSK